MPAPTWVDFYNTLMSSAQDASAKRAGDGTAGIGWSRTGDQYKVASKPSGKSFMDRAWNDNMSVGKRIIDVLSRGNYAAANFKLYQQQHQEQGYNPINALKDLGDIPGALGAAWEGLSGKSKKTFSDVNNDPSGIFGQHPELKAAMNAVKIGPMPGVGVSAETGLNFGEDVLLDPTTYIGGSTVKGAVKGAGKLAGRLTGKSAKITEAAVQPVEKRAAEELLTTGKTDIPVGKADAFVRDVTRNVNNPGDVFDNVVQHAPEPSAPALVGKVMPEGDRSFVAGPDGVEQVLKHPGRIYDERFMLPGASADVLAARAKTAELDNLAKGIPQFEYGDAVNSFDEFGPFRETVTRQPINDVPQVRPVGTAAKSADMADEWADLPPVTNPNAIRNAILRKNDEPVFSQYEKFVDERGVESFRPAKGAAESTVGELRRLIDRTGDDRAKAMLLQHIKTVEEYANNLAKKGPDITGYGTAKGYIKDVYPAEWEAARVALGGRPAAKKAGLDLTELPEGPMAVKPKEPTYKEIRKIEKMDFVEKMIYLHQFEGTLSKKDISYLASASNPKSFATRMQNIKNRVRAEGTQNVADLLDAIKTGRIQSVEEPGLSEVMKQTGAKTLPGLRRKLEEHLARQTKAEQKMLGKVQDANPVTVESKAGGIKELGPTGLPYSAYSGRAPEAMAKAEEIIKAKVAPAAQIVQEAKAGDKAALTRPASQLNVEQSKIFDRAMKWAVDQDVIQPRNKALWAYVTKRGVKRTSAVAGAGKGRRVGAWNKYSQYTFFKDMMQNAEKIDPAIKKVLDEAGMRGGDRQYARASAMYEMMMPVLKSMDDVLKQGGVFPVAGKAVGDNPFSLFDVLHALDPEFVKKNIFTLTKSKSGVASVIAPTQLMDVTNYLVDVLKQGETLDEKALADVKNLLMEQQKTNNGKMVPNALRNRVLAAKHEEDAAAILDDAAASIADAMPEIVSRVERNTAERKLFHENQVEKGTKQSLETIADLITDPTFSPADIAGLADNIKVDVIDKVSRLNGIDPDDAWMVQQEVTAKMPELGMPAEVAAQGRAINDMVKAKTASERVKVGVKVSRMAEEESGKIAEELGIPLSDLGTRIEQSLVYKMLKAFSPHLGNSAVRPYYLDRKSLTQSLARGYQALISDINRKHTKDAIAAAWKEAQNGTRSEVPEIAAAQDDLQQAINTFFSQDPNYNVFNRNNISAEDVNAHMDHFRIPEQFRLKQDDLEAWRDWDTNDPLNVLAKMQAATMAAMSKRMLGDDLTFRFGSTVKKEGYVKLSSHNSVLARYLDLEQYYPKDVAKQFRVLDDFIKQTMKPTEFRPVVNFLDNVLHSYKAGLTIYRPGHHVRNMVGDVWLSHMAGVNDPRYYTKAAKVMAQNHGRYRDFDAIKALMARQPVETKGAKFVDDGSPIVRLRNGQTMTAGEVYRAAYDQGIMNDYRTLEDIQMGAESFSDNLRKISPFKGKLNKGAASFSEARDHYVRLAHFMNDIEKGQGTLNEVVTKAAHNVRKWHPDGSDLSHFESSAMRRTFLFYSWIRKAMPLVVESMVMKPGKFMMYPKAMYNIAETNGIDLDSLSDPYPQDKLFPDWITDSPIGPVGTFDNGNLMGLNPGVPGIDVLNDYGGSQALRTTFGSTNPFLKIPLELAMSQGDASVATDMRTGIKNYDISDYADRQIPGFGYAASITGRSPSQLFLEAKGGADKQPEPNSLSFYNLLSGMGAFDMEKPSYQRQAHKDAKARYQQQMGGK